MLTDDEVAAITIAIYALFGIAGGYSNREKHDAKYALEQLLRRDRAAKSECKKLSETVPPIF